MHHEQHVPVYKFVPNMKHPQAYNFTRTHMLIHQYVWGTQFWCTNQEKQQFNPHFTGLWRELIRVRRIHRVAQMPSSKQTKHTADEILLPTD